MFKKSKACVQEVKHKPLRNEWISIYYRGHYTRHTGRRIAATETLHIIYIGRGGPADKASRALLGDEAPDGVVVGGFDGAVYGAAVGLEVGAGEDVVDAEVKLVAVVGDAGAAA